MYKRFLDTFAKHFFTHFISMISIQRMSVLSVVKEYFNRYNEINICKKTLNIYKKYVSYLYYTTKLHKNQEIGYSYWIVISHVKKKQLQSIINYRFLNKNYIF